MYIKNFLHRVFELYIVIFLNDCDSYIIQSMTPHSKCICYVGKIFSRSFLPIPFNYLITPPLSIQMIIALYGRAWRFFLGTFSKPKILNLRHLSTSAIQVHLDCLPPPWLTCNPSILISLIIQPLCICSAKLAFTLPTVYLSK